MKYSLVWNRIALLAKASGMNRRDAEAFYAAYEQALESDFESYSLGCVIAVGNQIVSRACNSEKTDPTQKEYNLRHREFNPGDYSNREHSLHAEIAALKSIAYPVRQQINWKRARAYVFRISPGKPYKQGLAAPCCACAHALADAGVRQVYFSTDYGFASSKLDVVEGLVFPDDVECGSEYRSLQIHGDGDGGHGIHGGDCSCGGVSRSEARLEMLG